LKDLGGYKTSQTTSKDKFKQLYNLQLNKERIMSLQDRVKATAKNIEGKVQETVGNLTGDPQAQTEGKEKQMEARVRHSVENVKDEVKKIIN
jgi:uncharacterized protein YjbJ (UPF0337 family)